MTKLINKVIMVNKRRTSMRLCCKEWAALEKICNRENISKNKLLETIENNKNPSFGLTSATRLFTTLYYQEAATQEMTTRPPRNHFLDIIKEVAS